MSTTARTAPWASSWRTLQEGLGPSATVGDDEVTGELGELGRWTMFEGFDMVQPAQFGFESVKIGIFSSGCIYI